MDAFQLKAATAPVDAVIGLLEKPQQLKAAKRKPRYETEVSIEALGIEWLALARFDARCERAEPDVGIMRDSWDVFLDSVAIKPASVLHTGTSWIDVDYSELPSDAVDSIELSCQRYLEEIDQEHGL